ncbi:MAG TPA: bifunctional 2',3'-cyclic-nucleotide 2'-phosphodiesterase/3'-nucleotidase [Rhodanobacteraceae bacterium]|nr:bifunctional 2',3'-cyclic-nucleotide 2'-phosphodiesterase/3'-nucleotidase [Rhodanobacteraceae bacterium]
MRARYVSILAAALLAACAAPAPKPAAVPAGSHAQLTLLETTDVHSTVMSYDYYKLKTDPSVGYERTATLIDQARKAYPNTLLFDAGDTIQGTVLADYQAEVAPIPCDQELAIYKAMDAMGYDAGTAGNHEFNYGLPFLSQVTGTPMDVTGVAAQHTCDGPNFPIILSNVFSARDGQPIFQPWTVLERMLKATTPDGRTIEAPIRIGVLGFTPPPIMDWDKHNLEGKVTVMGVVEAARKYLPALAAQHPDVIIAIVHGGISTRPYTPMLENAAWYLAEVPGIDAMLLGHSHQSFPGLSYKDVPEVDDQRGTVKGVPAVMANFFGRDLGLIHLSLDYRDGRWVSDRAQARSEVRPICPARNQCVAPDPRIAPLVASAHQAAIAYVDTPIGRSDFRMSSYFADLGDMSALTAVNAAQRDYVENWIASEHPEYQGIPVLSAAAAFRTGFGGPADYTDVAAGALSIRSAADLYFYPNTLAAVKIDGAGLKAWLEHSAGRFHRIDPASTQPQPLVNTRYKGYNFDQIQGGIHYTIDVTRPEGQRITALTYHGQPVAPTQSFLVVTNNYRASGGGHFPGLDGNNIVLMAPDGNREVLINWLRAHPDLHRAALEPRSWHFAPVKTRAPVTIESASGKLALAHQDGLTGVRLLGDHGDGTSTYAIDLSFRPKRQ